MDFVTRRSSRLQRQRHSSTNMHQPTETMEIETADMTTEDSVATSPEGRLKTSSSSSQTTPGLLRNAVNTIQNLCPPISQSVNDPDSDDEQCCPVCFEPWTNSGPHRLASLACGHLFGRSCLERWLKELKNKCCPQCKGKAKFADIRNIYAKALKAYDTTERDQAKKELKEEKYKRSKAEEGEAKMLLQYQILKQEMESLKRQIDMNASCSSTGTIGQRQPLATKHTSTFISTQASNETNQANGRTDRQRLTKSFSFQRSLQVSQKECRVLSYDQQNMLMVVSKPSPNQLFPGYGILKVSSLESRSSEYIRIHQKPIRDVKFNQSGDQLVLTASMDKTLKITSAISNSTVQSYNCPAPVWACAWNASDKNYLYGGLQNGACLIFDIRKTDSHLESIRPRIGVPCPIVSLHYVPKPTENTILNCEGLLVGTLQGGWFIQRNQASAYVDKRLLFPEGSCSGLYFEPMTRHCLLSQRPGKKCPRTVFSICRLSGDGSEEAPLQVNVTQKCYGGNRAQSLTRSSLFTCPDDDGRLLLCSGDEASSSVIVWDGDYEEEIQKLSSQGGMVFDVLNFSAYGSHFLAALTEQKLHFYQWK